MLTPALIAMVLIGTPLTGVETPCEPESRARSGPSEGPAERRFSRSGAIAGGDSTPPRTAGRRPGRRYNPGGPGGLMRGLVLVFSLLLPFAPAAPQASSAASPGSRAWELTWSDEFNGPDGS